MIHGEINIQLEPPNRKLSDKCLLGANPLQMPCKEPQGNCWQPFKVSFVISKIMYDVTNSGGKIKAQTGPPQTFPGKCGLELTLLHMIC
jgi:hypothetical protein